MSSRLLGPDSPHEVGRIAWRQVVAAEEASPPAQLEPAPEELRRECEERVAGARAEGRREGEAAGRAAAAAELQPVLERLARSMEEIASMRARLRREAEADTVQLALAIARRVVRRELSVDPAALHGIVLAALDKLQAGESCRVRVHPSHANALAALVEKRAAAAVEIVGDASQAPGAVLVETGRGSLDASVETQLGEIERGLADVLRRQS